MLQFDALVVGGGHAGCEAAHALSRLGLSTALITLDSTRIGVLSCNPAVGGLAKGQLAKEVDALGGLMARVTDLSAIQYRRLNASKGPAVQASRAQCDKALYAQSMQQQLKRIPGLKILSTEVADLLLESGRISGVRLSDGQSILSRAVVITSGTFLRAVMHTGSKQVSGGRQGDAASQGLSASLERLGFQLRRLKTGTPPRLLRETINYARLQSQGGDKKPLAFSFFSRLNPFPYLPQVQCHITYTNQKTHNIIECNLNKSPIFNGAIQGIGPRYCPSIEDKVNRFKDRSRHQIFLEPEGLSTNEVYVNGVSTSLPNEVQKQFIKSIVGLEHAQFARFGYAVEYDCIDARMLTRTFQCKDVPGLFFAGQINGTSGYEEAAAQGIIAGINAGLFLKNKDPFIIKRSEAYIGVLTDDLVLKGIDEPYRMFSSRAEHRLLLREDNADLRLSQYAESLGLLEDWQKRILEKKQEDLEEAKKLLSQFYLYPSIKTDQYFESREMTPLKDRIAGDVFLRRPEVSWDDLCLLGLQGSGFSALVKEQIEIQVKYAGYIQRDLDFIKSFEKNENLCIPFSLNFDQIPGLSNEIKSRFKLTRPETLGQASRMLGVTPAAVANLLIFMKITNKKPQNPEQRFSKRVF